MTNRTALLTLALSLLWSLSGAQEIRVFNKTTLEPIPDVLIYNTARGLYEISDARGKVQVSGVKPSDTLIIQHQAFVTEYIALRDLALVDYEVFLTQKIVLIEEVVISASKTPESVSELANQVRVVGDREIRFRNPQTSADLLAQTGEVFVQKSQMGGGSPVLRGFEANKVLLVLDGVRMNNAIYRAGHLQNSITLDASSLDRAEVVFGPGAVIYGSDAIGGVMHYVTRRPIISADSGTVRLDAEVYGRIASANFEKTAHASLNVGVEKFGSYTAFTYSNFDDLRMGTRRSHGFTDWGLSPYYVGRLGGRDTVLENSDPNKQVYTGYSQWNLLQKFRYVPKNDLEFGLTFLGTSSSEIPRYEDMNDFEVVDGLPQPPRTASWYYGPQRYYLASAQVHVRERRAFDDLQLTGAYQWVQEERLVRRFGNPWRRAQIENVQVASVNGDFQKALSEKNTLRYGFEANYNRVLSRVEGRNVDNGNTMPLNEPTRYPDGGSHTQAYAFYLMNKWKPLEKIILQTGIRYSHFILRSEFRDTTFIALPEPDFKLSRGALSGSAGLVYKPVSGLELKFGISSGFRAPNVDDYGKIREEDGEVTIPSPDLGPEYAYNFEFGLVKNFDDIARLSFTAYYTHLTDAIVRSHTRVNGSDSILYEGDSAYIIINENIQNARVYGVAVGFYTDIGKYISMSATFNYTRGMESPGGAPLAHIPPIYGRVSLLTKVKRFQGELFMDYNGQKTLDNYSDSGEDRLDEATALGTPGWFTVNLRTSVQVHRMLSLQFAIENIFDQHYKVFASGLSAPGRNFIVTLRGRFRERLAGIRCYNRGGEDRALTGVQNRYFIIN